MYLNSSYNTFTQNLELFKKRIFFSINKLIVLFLYYILDGKGKTMSIVKHELQAGNWTKLGRSIMFCRLEFCHGKTTFQIN